MENKDKIIQIVVDTSIEGYLLFGLGESGDTYIQVGTKWEKYIESPQLLIPQTS